MNTDFLSTIPIFSSLSATELNEIAEHWTVLKKKPDEVIFKANDPADTIYLIKEGNVRITVTDFHGDDLLVSILKRGEMFGELTLFEITKRTATATTSEHTTLLQMPRQTFISFLKKYPDIAIRLLAVISTRLRDTNEILLRQVTRNVNEEVETEFTLGDRIADKFASFIGSWMFIIIFVLVVISWMALNTYAILFPSLDRFPFILLNLILSCIAAIQGPVIMMSQGRQAKKDRIAADLDYKINLKAELQIEEILIRLDGFRRDTAATEKEAEMHHTIVEKLNAVLEKLK